METKKITSKLIVSLLSMAITLGTFIGCTEREIPLETTSDVLITTYIENDSLLSDFFQILNTTHFDGFLNAYGVYTCFAPTNGAIAQYAADKGKSSWKELSVDELKKLVSLHVINGFFKTSSFSDGKMSKATMAGEYLTSSVSIDANNIASVQVSADNLLKASLIKSNIELGNGVLHMIDKVLTPPTNNLAEIVEKMRSQGFSIFADAMVATGLSDTLSKVNIGTSDTLRRWFTILAESDEAFNANGITSLDDLKDKYSTKDNPKDPEDSLYIFMAYRILHGINFLADFARNDTSVSGKDLYTTVVPSENTLIKRIPNSESIDVVLERDMFMKITKSLPIVRAQSDIKATNGVFHAVNGHYKITVKHPTPVYWEMTEMPEVMAHPNFRKTIGTVTFSNGMLAGVTFQGPYANRGAGLDYQFLTMTETGSYPVMPTNGDWFQIQCRTAVISSFTITTPEINKGKYKIWACCRISNTSGNVIKVVWDDTTTMPFKIRNTLVLDTTKSEAQLEAEGFKTYLAPSKNHGSYIGFYLGSVDLKTTKRHKMTFVGETNSTKNRESYFDMLHFIPVDMDQLWPKFKQDGSMVTREQAGR